MGEKVDGIQMSLGRFATHSEVMDVMQSVYKNFAQQGVAAQRAGKKNLAKKLFKQADIVTICKSAYAEKHDVCLAGSSLTSKYQ